MRLNAEEMTERSSIVVVAGTASMVIKTKKAKSKTDREKTVVLQHVASRERCSY